MGGASENWLAEKYPIATKKHVRCETIGNREVHLRDVKTVHSGDLDNDRGILKAKCIKDTGEIESVDNGSRDL